MQKLAPIGGGAQARATALTASEERSSRSLSFPSARYVYPRSSWALNSLDEQRRQKPRPDGGQSIRDRFNALRQQLESELKQAGGLVLGSPCFSSSDCALSIKNAHCQTQNFTCSCLTEHVPLNPTTCLAPALLGYECQLDAQCQQKVPDSICQAGKCACPAEKFVAYKKSKCLAPSKLDDYCLADGQCQLNDKHSYCKWKIPNVYGTCKCPPNYKLLTVDSTPAEAGAGLNGTEASSGLKATSPRCAPRLGDACLSDDECRLTTPNSICSAAQLERSQGSLSAAVAPRVSQAPRGGLAEASRLAGFRPQLSAWQTSSASTNRCTCAREFVWASNRLDCIARAPAEASTSSPETTSEQSSKEPGQSLLQDSHKYEMIVIPTPAQQESAHFESNRTSDDLASSALEEQFDIRLLHKTTPAGTTTTTTTTTTTSTSTQKPSTGATGSKEALPGAESSVTSSAGGGGPTQRMSSLGKPCATRQECQARDPHSDCVGGICECQMPTSRCRANSTGCPRDTFQCRNGQCISWYFVCDQFENCDDASDEHDCKPRACPRESFQCVGDGTCVTRGKICNGKRDCSDGSDELNCGGPAAGQQHSSGAANSIIGNSTMRSTLSAHYNATATDGNLEGGDRARAPCHPDSFTCYDGQCLPAYVFCNAVQDCRDGSDEDELVCELPSARRKWLDIEAQASRAAAHPRGASPNANATELPATVELLRLASATGTPPSRRTADNEPRPADGESPLVKTDRASIQRLVAALALASRTPEGRGRPGGARVPAAARDRRAKLLRRVAEASDLSPMSRKPPDECPRWAFTCANGKCRSSAILCSGVDGCGDNSDEHHCEVCQCEPPAHPT